MFPQFLDVAFQVFQAGQERLLSSQGAGATQGKKRSKHVDESEVRSDINAHKNLGFIA